MDSFENIKPQIFHIILLFKWDRKEQRQTKAKKTSLENVYNTGMFFICAADVNLQFLVNSLPFSCLFFLPVGAECFLLQTLKQSIAEVIR